VPGHSGEDQFSILLPVLEDYGIVQMLGAVIADNAAPNNVLCRVIEAHWDKKLNMKWKADHWCDRAKSRGISHRRYLTWNQWADPTVEDIQMAFIYENTKLRRGESGSSLGLYTSL
jgi:hypothetical protein